MGVCVWSVTSCHVRIDVRGKEESEVRNLAVKVLLDEVPG